MTELQQTHWVGCWQERSHHQCALEVIAELRDDLEGLKLTREELKELRGIVLTDALRKDYLEALSPLFSTKRKEKGK